MHDCSNGPLRITLPHQNQNVSLVFYFFCQFCLSCAILLSFSLLLAQWLRAVDFAWSGLKVPIFSFVTHGPAGCPLGERSVTLRYIICLSIRSTLYVNGILHSCHDFVCDWFLSFFPDSPAPAWQKCSDLHPLYESCPYSSELKISFLCALMRVRLEAPLVLYFD